MNDTFGAILDEMYTVIAETDESTEYTLDKVKTKVKNVYGRVCSWKMIRIYPREWTAITAKSLSFLSKTLPITVVADSITTSETAVNAAVVEMDTTNMPTTWSMLIYGNIVNYTGKTATSITGCTGVLALIPQSSKAKLITKISDLDIYKPKSMAKQNTDGSTDPLAYVEWGTNGYWERFSIIKQDWEQYIIVLSSYSGQYWLTYTRIPPELVENSDEIILEHNAGLYCIAPIWAWEMLWKSEEIELAQEKLVLGYDYLVEFYGKYALDLSWQPQSVEYDQVTSFI